MMLLVPAAVLFSVLGATALQISNYGAVDTSRYSIAGYIAFIISFAILEYSLISFPLPYTFGLWAAGNVLLNTAVGKILFEEEFSRMKFFSSGLILLGMLGFALA